MAKVKITPNISKSKGNSLFFWKSKPKKIKLKPVRIQNTFCKTYLKCTFRKIIFLIVFLQLCTVKNLKSLKPRMLNNLQFCGNTNRFL